MHYLLFVVFMGGQPGEVIYSRPTVWFPTQENCETQHLDIDWLIGAGKLWPKTRHLRFCVPEIETVTEPSAEASVDAAPAVTAAKAD